MEATIKGNRIRMGYDCEMVESVARLNKSKKAKLSLYAYYEEKESSKALNEICVGEAGDITICKSDRYFWLLEGAAIKKVSRKYHERYISAYVEIEYSSASGASSEALIKRNSALKKLLGE